jgi:hypothetical protein
MLPELEAKTRRSRGAQRPRARPRGAGESSVPDALKETSKGKKEELYPNPFNIQGWRFQKAEPDCEGVCLSPCDRAPAVRLLDKFTAAGNKGYRSVRATHGVSRGAWMYEMTLLPDSPQTGEEKFNRVAGHVRVGWARSQAELQAPVGFDRFGYGVASKTGDKVHLRKLEPLWPRALQAGDVVGCYISLPALEGEPPPPIYDVPKVCPATASKQPPTTRHERTRTHRHATARTRRAGTEWRLWCWCSQDRCYSHLSHLQGDFSLESMQHVGHEVCSSC